MCYNNRQWFQLCQSIFSVLEDSSDSTTTIAEDVEGETEEVIFKNVDEMLTFDSEEMNIDNRPYLSAVQTAATL